MINDVILFLLVLGAAASGTWLYLQWLDAEHRRHPADRSVPARAILGTWGAIRAAVDRILNAASTRIGRST